MDWGAISIIGGWLIMIVSMCASALIFASDSELAIGTISIGVGIGALIFFIGAIATIRKEYGG